MPWSHIARRVTSEGKDAGADGKTGKLDFKNLWILKPVGLNRGQGIHVVNSLKQCKKLIREYYFGKEYQVGGQGTSPNKEEAEQLEMEDLHPKSTVQLNHERINDQMAA